MAVVAGTGFELGATLDALGTGGTVSIDGTTKRTGNYSLRSNPTTTGVGWFRTANDNPGVTGFDLVDVWYRFYFRAATLPSANNEPICEAERSADGIGKMEVRISSGGVLSAYDSTGTLMATGTTALSTGTWYRLELRVGTGAAANWEVKINGTSEISGTGNLNTGNNGKLVLGKPTNRNGETVDFYYDDFVADDAAYPGPGGCVMLLPTGDGTYTSWTGVYTAADEVPHNSDTDYLTSTLVVGDAETVTLADSSTLGISGTIHYAKPIAIARRNGAAPSGNFKVRSRSATTNTDSAAAVSGGVYAQFALFHATDPATAAAWTTGGIDALEAGGVENDGVNNRTRITFVGVMVDFEPAAAGAGAGPIFRGRALGSGRIFGGSALTC